MNAQYRCPHCGATSLSDPAPIVKEGLEELLALGITVPISRQCLGCTCTLCPSAFVIGSEEYERVRAGRHGAPKKYGPTGAPITSLGRRVT